MNDELEYKRVRKIEDKLLLKLLVWDEITSRELIGDIKESKYQKVKRLLEEFEEQVDVRFSGIYTLTRGMPVQTGFKDQEIIDKIDLGTYGSLLLMTASKVSVEILEGKSLKKQFLTPFIEQLLSNGYLKDEKKKIRLKNVLLDTSEGALFLSPIGNDKFLIMVIENMENLGLIKVNINELIQQLNSLF